MLTGLCNIETVTFFALKKITSADVHDTNTIIYITSEDMICNKQNILE